MADLLNELFCPLELTGIAASLTEALGVEAPKQAEPALEIMKNFTHGKNIDRVLMYNPDAVALWLFGKYTDIFEPVMLNTQLTLPLKTVMPSVTPVCFATMYTGVTPDTHGIKAYRKPVVKTDSVFDALIRAGKKPCIVSTGEDSMSKIFLEREMDYFIVSTPDEANAKAVELIKEDKYDLICVYNGNYDGVMHKVSPEGKEAIEALRHNSAAFKLLADAVRENWKSHTTLIGYAPDHGCHEIDGESGGHGLEMPEDMNIIHFYGVI
ncbi:MAG: alkaline phosphatase family protein [Clostridia bacterium]|nr:alkaline phosphatase family protein [Clostridia bacterium]